MNKSNSVPLIFLIGAFILGNGVINLPFAKYKDSAFFGLIIAVLVSFPLFLLFDKISASKKDIIKKSAFGKFFLLFYCLYCLFSGLICMRNFITFSDKVILPEINSFFPIILYLLLIYLLCISDKSIIIKTAFSSGLVIVFIMLFLFIISFGNMKISNLIPKDSISIKGIIYEGLSYICLCFIPSVSLIGFLLKKEPKNCQKNYAKGFLLGVFLLTLTFFQSALSLGYNLASALMHPYASSVSLITFGNSQSRMEGFSYFIYFASSLIKTAVCVYAAKESFSFVAKKAEKFFLPAVSVLYGGISLFVSSFNNVEFIKIAPYIIAPAVIIIVVFCSGIKGIKER